VERVFSQHNVRTVMGTAQASAVAMLCAARRGIPVALHTPSEVKAAVTGSGRADKAQVGAMVTRLLRLDAPPKPADAADALALAICHIWRAPARTASSRPSPRTGCKQAVAQHAAGARSTEPKHRRPRTHRKAVPHDRLRQRHGRRTRPDAAVVEVGGVGMAIQCTPNTLSTLRLGKPAKLATSLVVREDSLTLYGFVDDDERQIFELLQTATGVGPRLAQAMLAVHTPDALRRAVAAGDEKALMAVPGHRQEGRPEAAAGVQGPARRPRRVRPGDRRPGHQRLARSAARRADRPRVRHPRGRRGRGRRSTAGRGRRRGKPQVGQLLKAPCRP
jgi:hypothetical protein